jgi:hypothetical protein
MVTARYRVRTEVRFRVKFWAMVLDSIKVRVRFSVRVWVSVKISIMASVWSQAIIS